MIQEIKRIIKESEIMKYAWSFVGCREVPVLT